MNINSETTTEGLLTECFRVFGDERDNRNKKMAAMLDFGLEARDWAGAHARLKYSSGIEIDSLKSDLKRLREFVAKLEKELEDARKEARDFENKLFQCKCDCSKFGSELVDLQLKLVESEKREKASLKNNRQLRHDLRVSKRELKIFKSELGG